MSHPYIPATESDEQEMLAHIGVQALEDLVAIIPSELRMQGPLDLPPPMAEMELALHLGELAARNSAADKLCFLGGGAYDHYTPAAVKSLAMRSEFYTAYTPYQAEVSQGTLQVMYEFQSMICQITGMDVANASLYDGPSAAAEACLMAVSSTRRKKILIPETVHPRIVQVIETYLQNRNVIIELLPCAAGAIDPASLTGRADDLAAILVQSPNGLGVVEDWAAVRSVLPAGTLLIAYSDPLTLGMLESPGSAGADIYVGEGQTLGIPLSFGGPYLGLLAARKKYIRKLPGRMAGRTVDVDGKPGFVMVLRTREQDIRREKATSNICTNQGLLALWAAIYMSLLGKQGLTELARLCFDKSQYLARQISKLSGYRLPYGNRFLKEFLVAPAIPAADLSRKAADAGFLLGVYEYGGHDYIQIAVTERRTRSDLDALVKFLDEVRA